MKGWIIIGLIAIAAIACDVHRNRKYRPRAWNAELKNLCDARKGTEGNLVRAYTEAGQMLRDLEADIDSAEESVHVQFFRFDSDCTGRELSDHLIACRKRGVEVRVLYDGLTGMWNRPGFFRRMRKAGIEVHAFNGLWPFPSWYLNNRNHRKIAVIDSEIGYIGGMNISHKYIEGIRKGNWRDTHLRIAGPAALQLQKSFLCDWSREAKNWELESMEDVKNYFPHLDPFGETRVQIVSSQPKDEGPWLEESVCRLIDNAREYVWLQSPYFIPTKALRHSIEEAAELGTDVRLMVPKRGDRSILVTYATRRQYAWLLNAGVKIYEYEHGFMHAKTTVSDGNTSMVGSCNLDIRSFTQSFETSAFIYDKAFGVEMQKQFAMDMMHCHEVEKERWKRRGPGERLMEQLARPLIHFM